MPTAGPPGSHDRHGPHRTADARAQRRRHEQPSASGGDGEPRTGGDRRGHRAAEHAGGRAAPPAASRSPARAAGPVRAVAVNARSRRGGGRWRHARPRTSPPQATPSAAAISSTRQRRTIHTAAAASRARASTRQPGRGACGTRSRRWRASVVAPAPEKTSGDRAMTNPESEPAPTGPAPRPPPPAAPARCRPPRRGREPGRRRPRRRARGRRPPAHAGERRFGRPSVRGRIGQGDAGIRSGHDGPRSSPGRRAARRRFAEGHEREAPLRSGGPRPPGRVGETGSDAAGPGGRPWAGRGGAGGEGSPTTAAAPSRPASRRGIPATTALRGGPTTAGGPRPRAATTQPPAHRHGGGRLEHRRRAPPRRPRHQPAARPGADRGEACGPHGTGWRRTRPRARGRRSGHPRSGGSRLPGGAGSVGEHTSAG